MSTFNLIYSPSKIFHVQQEEIRFCVSPELIVARLFQLPLEDNEAILVRGFENFSRYRGYAQTLKYDGPYHDPAHVSDS